MTRKKYTKKKLHAIRIACVYHFQVFKALVIKYRRATFFCFEKYKYMRVVHLAPIIYNPVFKKCSYLCFFTQKKKLIINKHYKSVTALGCIE